MSNNEAKDLNLYFQKHFNFGWWSLLFFLSLGAILEVLHGFKVSWYIDNSNETRRFLFTLAHAHGSLLAILNLIFAISLEKFTNIAGRLKLISLGLLLSSILLPVGFLLGGIAIYGSDPGIGIILAIVGAVIFIITIKKQHSCCGSIAKYVL